MFPLVSDDRDAPEFVSLVGAVVESAAAESAATSVVIVKVDTWFGQRWLRFSHKVLGAFGVASHDLVVPPFVPNRVHSQDHLDHRAAAWQPSDTPLAALHVRQVSADNAQRKLSRLGPELAFFWWSGNSLPNGRGSLTAYLPSPEGHVAWYIEARAALGWRAGVAKGISPARVAELASHAA